MPFMVIYRTSDGSSTFEQLDAIDEAALFVERLRNNEGVDQIRIYRMEEISFAFRPYYKVELGMPERQQHPSPPSDVVGSGAVPAPTEARAVVELVDQPPVEDDGPADEVDAIDDATDAVRDAPGDSVDLGPNGARRGLFGR